jgi:hypothetical protein
MSTNAAPTFAERVHRFAFAPLAGLDDREEVLANTRLFLGDGTPFLKVPGLKSLEAVRQGTQVLPAEIVQEYPTDHTLRRLETVAMPSVILGRAADGTPVLRRNICSNDGLWQDGREFSVTGEWDETVPEAPLPEKPARKNSRS